MTTLDKYVGTKLHTWKKASSMVSPPTMIFGLPLSMGQHLAIIVFGLEEL
jgi:hypothetical protein